MKDSSLKVPSGVFGKVMGVKVSSKKESDKGVKSAAIEAKKQAKQLEDDYKKELNSLHEQLTKT